MILAELEIEDYKQFGGHHRFTPPPQGIVGIIGQNGAGKTTLFEAIEWCLYNPREISADEIPTRGQVAKPRVKVVLQDPHEGTRYVIERTLKRGVSHAEIYREDQPESRIVSGPRQVTAYVSQKLIGLDHGAFVSTFFTRQKELTFFGNLRDTDRRREVGRLLGLETIRAAQKVIADDRNKAKSDAQSLLGQYREQSADRDFAAEVTAANESITNRETALADAELALTAARTNHATARDRVAELQTVARRDADLRTDLERVAGDERTATAQQSAALKELERLDTAANARVALAATAETEATHASAVQSFDVERERQVELDRHNAEITRSTKALTNSSTHLHKIVNYTNAAAVADWRWLPSDAIDPIGAAARLIAVAESQNVFAAIELAKELETCFNLVRTRDEEQVKFEKFTQALKQIEQQRVELLTLGDPRQLVIAAQHERDTVLASIQQTKSAIAQANETIGQLEPIVINLRSNQLGERCPTCTRPFTANEIALTIEALSDRIDGQQKRVSTLQAKQSQAQKQVKVIEKQLADANDAHNQLTKFDERINAGNQKVAEQHAIWQHAIHTCADTIAMHGFDSEPTREMVSAAQERADLLRRVAATVPALNQVRGVATTAVADRDTAVAAIAELGPVAYDGAAHAAARRSLSEAQQAAATVRQIDQDLARRPSVELDRDTASGRLTDLAAERTQLELARAELGFDPAALKAANQQEQAALAAERQAVEVRGNRHEAHRSAVITRDRLLEEQARIAKLAERADQRTRESDTLDMMYKEFTLFEQYVARRITPQLAEHTGELLGAVTDGKYDRVEFNENYGIEVYDGDDERFPMDEFSGGERDVIALCARLALSRLIGSQANNPPGFLVLDEVFGALDRDRRMQVLETLGALSGTADAFHQLFIISHVDDVRTAPIFNEVWRVAEISDGTSTLENLSETHGVEDF